MARNSFKKATKAIYLAKAILLETLKLHFWGVMENLEKVE